MNLDFSDDILHEGYNFFEKSILVGEKIGNSDSDDYQHLLKTMDKQLGVMEIFPSPRIFKSHLPAHFLPADIWIVMPKIIYVHRHAKDAAVSMYHMLRNPFTCPIEWNAGEIFRSFFGGSCTFRTHINSFKRLSKLEHIHLMSYEDMIADPFAVVKRISEFLSFEYSDEQLKQPR